MDPAIVSSIILGVFGLIITIYYSSKKQKLSHERMLKELFTEFNQRYNNLDDSLCKLRDLPDNIDEEKLPEELKYKINEFFNLCAEEYYWVKKERIDKDIWESWQMGMNYWYNNIPIMRKIWDSETREDSWKAYYLKQGEKLFNQ